MSITAPTDISGCKLWLKGDTVTLTSGKVSTWPDQSGIGNDFTQSTAGNRPTVSSAELNGHDVVAFDPSSSQYLTGPNLFSGASAGEIFCVLKATADPNATSGNTGLWSFGTDPNSITNNSHYPYTDGVVYDSFGSTLRKSATDPAASLSSTYRVFNVSSGASNWVARLDRTTLASFTTNTVGFPTAPTIGKSVGAFYLDGKIAEVVCYNSVLTATQRKDVWDYFLARYTLPPTPPSPTAPSFSSSDVVGWYKADTGVTLVSSKVSQWDDNSGNGNHATQSNATNRPTVDASGINGQYAIRFTEANSQALLLPNLLPSATACEGMIVFKLDTDPPGGDAYGALWRNDATSTPYFPAGDGTIYEAWGSGSRRNFSHTGQNLASKAHVYDVWSASGDYGVILDTTTLYTSASNTVNTIAAPRFGHNGSDAGLDGCIAEVVIFNRKMTATERGQWRDYLNTKYVVDLPDSGYTPPPSSGRTFRVASFVG